MADGSEIRAFIKRIAQDREERDRTPVEDQIRRLEALVREHQTIERCKQRYNHQLPERALDEPGSMKDKMWPPEPWARWLNCALPRI